MLSNGQTWTLIAALISLCTFVMGAMFASLRSELASVCDGVRGEIGSLRDGLRREIAALRSEVTAEIRAETAEIRAEMHGGFSVLGAQVAQLTDRVQRLEG